MDGTAVDKIAGLVEGHVLEPIDGLQYSTKPIHIIRPPVPGTLKLHTLAGLVELLDINVEKATREQQGCFLHVVDHQHVAVKTIQSDAYGQEVIFAEATPLVSDGGFVFGRYMSPEEFNIGLRANFVTEQSPDLDYVLKTVSSITASAASTVEDDGISQNVEVKAGIVTKNRAIIKPIVALAPYRTFREVAQPTSDFLLRLKISDTSVQVALFEADGQQWKLDAVDRVATWLKNNVKGSSVSTTNDVPVVA